MSRELDYNLLGPTSFRTHVKKSFLILRNEFEPHYLHICSVWNTLCAFG